MSALGHQRTSSECPGDVRFPPKSGHWNSAAKCPLCAISGHFPLSTPRRALGDDVDDLERHHYFAALIDYLDERGDRAAIGL